MSLPTLFRFLLPEDFRLLHLPKEKIADCDHCPKVMSGEYRADCRCCTYFPQVPNFQIGLALKNPDTRPHVDAVIAAGHVLPTGMQMTPSHYYTSLSAYAAERFGQNEGMRCPFIDQASGLCKIHAYRNSVCATFFCEHDHAAAGAAYWNRVQTLLGQIELAVGQWAMKTAGMDLDAYIRRLNQSADKLPLSSGDSPNVWSEAFRRHLWGERFGDEAAFLEACADAVMTHRDSLYEIACNQPLRLAFEFEKAVEAAAPEDCRDEMQRLPGEQAEPMPVSDLWYKLQLATRKLWDLPFNEGTVVQSPAVRIAANPKNDTLSRHHQAKPFVLTMDEKDGPWFPRFLSAKEAAVLALFQEPQIMGEALLENKMVSSLEDPRAFLAECLQSGVLVKR